MTNFVSDIVNSLTWIVFRLTDIITYYSNGNVEVEATCNEYLMVEMIVQASNCPQREVVRLILVFWKRVLRSLLLGVCVAAH